MKRQVVDPDPVTNDQGESTNATVWIDDPNDLNDYYLVAEIYVYAFGTTLGTNQAHDIYYYLATADYQGGHQWRDSRLCRSSLPTVGSWRLPRFPDIHHGDPFPLVTRQELAVIHDQTEAVRDDFLYIDTPLLAALQESLIPIRNEVNAEPGYRTLVFGDLSDNELAWMSVHLAGAVTADPATLSVISPARSVQQGSLVTRAYRAQFQHFQKWKVPKVRYTTSFANSAPYTYPDEGESSALYDLIVMMPSLSADELMILLSSQWQILPSGGIMAVVTGDAFDRTPSRTNLIDVLEGFEAQIRAVSGPIDSRPNVVAWLKTETNNVHLSGWPSALVDGADDEVDDDDEDAADNPFAGASHVYVHRRQYRGTFEGPFFEQGLIADMPVYEDETHDPFVNIGYKYRVIAVTSTSCLLHHGTNDLVGWVASSLVSADGVETDPFGWTPKQLSINQGRGLNFERILELVEGHPDYTGSLTARSLASINRRKGNLVGQPQPGQVVYVPYRVEGPHDWFLDGMGAFLDGSWVGDAHNALHGVWAAADEQLGRPIQASGGVIEAADRLLTSWNADEDLPTDGDVDPTDDPLESTYNFAWRARNRVVGGTAGAFQAMLRFFTGN